VTAGTVFDRTRTPLSAWFHACWLFCTGKDGISALSLQRTLEIGSYQTAWAMLHRLRSVLVRPGRERLSGLVEVDETFIGGMEPGLRRGREHGKKVLTGIAVEVFEPKGLGRCRIATLADGSAESLLPFITDHVEPGAIVTTDGWSGYNGLAKLGYVHHQLSQRAARAAGDDTDLLPNVHRIAALLSAGCWAPTKARSSRRTFPPTSTSTSSGSTAGPHVAGACCSSAYSSSPWTTTRSATKTSSPTRSPSPSPDGRAHRPRADDRQAWSVRPRTGLGAPRPGSALHWIAGNGHKTQV
jgi:hypothetical protein